MLFELLERWESGDLVVATLMFFFLLVTANSQTNKKSTRERIYAGNGDLVSVNKQIIAWLSLSDQLNLIKTRNIS